MKPQRMNMNKKQTSMIVMSAAVFAAMTIGSSVSYADGAPTPGQPLSPTGTQAIRNSISHALHGTGVGNGGNSARDAYLANLKRELAVRPNSGNPSGAITAWCSQVSSVLLRERSRAMLQYQYEQMDGAEQILIDALVTAAQSLDGNPNPKPMTKKLLDRTLIYSQALDQVLSGSDRLSEVTKLNFLFSSVDFIVDVARNLDPPYYIPYQYQYGGCERGCPSTFPFEEFERHFVQMAARDLSFVVGDLTEAGAQSGAFGSSGQIYPVGDPRAFLTVASLVTSDVADDLSENLHAYENACVIGDLQTLSQELSSYTLSGDRSIFPNDQWAISQSAEEMMRISNRIRANSPCSGYGSPAGYGDSYGNN